MWGFIVTLVAFIMDVWRVAKALSESTIESVGTIIIACALNPFVHVWGLVLNTTYGMAMLFNLREALGDVLAPKYPWSKSHIKIILGCKVIVNLSQEVHKENHNFNAFMDNASAKDLSEALVIGLKAANSEPFNVQLTKLGKLGLLRSNVLPPYDELKILQGNSSLGLAIASAKVIGYIYGIVVRRVQGLQVSSIEAIACILNMLILVKGVLHNKASVDHRPLLLYLPAKEETKFIEECKNTQSLDFKSEGRFKFGVSIICGILLGVGLYLIVNCLQSLSRTFVVPIVLFEVSIVLEGILRFILPRCSDKILGGMLSISIVLLNLVGFVWALVVTFKYWKGEDFDVQSSNYLSQVLPCIG